MERIQTSPLTMRSNCLTEALGVWEADNEEDLIEEITATFGWCIRNIHYEIQLK